MRVGRSPVKRIRMRRHPRKITRVLWLGGSIVALVAFLANIAQVAQFLRITPPKLVRSAPTPSDLLGELLSQAPSCKPQKSLSFMDSITLQEQKCKGLPPGRPLAACRLLLGEYYATEGRYRDSLAAYNLARDGSPEMADAYYARGDLFYQLATFDLAKRGRIHINPDSVSASADIDERTLKLFSLVTVEYNEAARRALFSGVVPVEVSAYRNDQIRAVSAGAKQISFHRLELLDLAVLLMCLYHDDDRQFTESMRLAFNVVVYIRAHRNEFPNLSPDIWR